MAAGDRGYDATGDTHLKVRAKGQVPQPKRHVVATQEALFSRAAAGNPE